MLDDVGPVVDGGHLRAAAVGSFGAPTPEALLRAVHDAATDLASVRDRGVILQALVRRTRALLGADMAYLSLNDLDAGETWIHVTDGVRTAAYAGIRMPLGTGILGAVAAGGTSVHTDDYLADRDLNHLTHIDAVVAEEGVRAISGEPLRVDGHLVGALLVAHRTPVAMPPAGLAALRLMALQAAVALEQTRRAGEIAELRDAARAARDDAARLEQKAAEAEALLALDARLLAAVETGSGCHAVLEEVAAELAAPVALLDARGEVRSGSPTALPDDAQPPGSECAVEGGRGCLVTPASGARADAVLGRGALAVGLALQVEHELAEAADRSASTLLDDLLGDHLDDGPDGDRAARREVAEARALSHGVDLRAPASSLVVLVPAAERQRGVAALRPLVARGGLVSVHAGHVCLLCPAGGSTTDAVGDRVAEALATAGVPGLVGSATAAGRGAGPLQRAHAEAAQAARAAQVLGWRRGHADRARLGLAGLLLGGHDEQVVDALVEQQLGPALAYDAAHGTRLVETAAAVLEEGSRTGAAARLFVHVNTVRQRAERLGELLGQGWDVPPRSLDVHAALRLQVLRAARGGTGG
ncbi:GAF domain-containing protein [Pseudokineococcus lusitanus]|uniref:GAF domain-containing protein n=1 Tax=Pseudokineococcus lusitanus TaxID=763993 RepID=A0A3N1GWM6_9ACTN|nr:GAF domain-containing protein [Pseudokineococcus lusitanus]ROP34562.1 GAF domain-containing protein [Pseudokineococcus lusitanus]